MPCSSHHKKNITATLFLSFNEMLKASDNTRNTGEHAVIVKASIHSAET